MSDVNKQLLNALKGIVSYVFGNLEAGKSDVCDELRHLIAAAERAQQAEPRCACGDSFTSDAMCANCLASTQAVPVALDVLMAAMREAVAECAEICDVYSAYSGARCASEIRHPVMEGKLADIADRYAAQPPAVADVARVIWNIRREEEDRCDMELEDIGTDHSVWREAEAVCFMLAAAQKGGA